MKYLHGVMLRHRGPDTLQPTVDQLSGTLTLEHSMVWSSQWTVRCALTVHSKHLCTHFTTCTLKYFSAFAFSLLMLLSKSGGEADQPTSLPTVSPRNPGARSWTSRGRGSLLRSGRTPADDELRTSPAGPNETTFPRHTPSPLSLLSCFLPLSLRLPSPFSFSTFFFLLSFFF